MRSEGEWAARLREKAKAKSITTEAKPTPDGALSQ
jgi:hypothetical protein